MKLPTEVPVMTLPEIQHCFAGVAPALHIRAALPANAGGRSPLKSNVPRSHAAAGEHAGVAFTSRRIRPYPGFSRHRDGTSHLILQGLARVQLAEAVRYKPYRVQRIRALATPPCDNVKVDALVAKVRELLQERIELGLPFPFPVMSPDKAEMTPAPPSFSPKEILSYLDSISDPEQAADLVSCAVLPGAAERQAILETVDVEARLRRLIHFLLAEIKAKRKGGGG